MESSTDGGGILKQQDEFINPVSVSQAPCTPVPVHGPGNAARDRRVKVSASMKCIFYLEQIHTARVNAAQDNFRQQKSLLKDPNKGHLAVPVGGVCDS